MTDSDTTNAAATGENLPVVTTPRHAEVRHDPSYVTLLLAHAAGLPSMPLRRRSDRKGPLSAYTDASAGPVVGKTRRII